MLTLGLLSLWGCPPPKFVPLDLAHLKSPEDLGLKSQEAYQKARNAQQKSEKLKWSQAGMAYSEKCLKFQADEPLCLYYGVLNRGVFVQNHIFDYQKSLRLMVAQCEALIAVDPNFQHAGCYRILGNIFSKAPAFSLNPKNISQDLDKASEYFQQAVKLSPDYALNHLFLARNLAALGNKAEAQQQLAEFDRLRTPDLDQEYPQWKQDREQLAQSLH